jgi:WD40 repeat protein
MLCLVQVRSKVTCLGWSPRGDVLALGLDDGCISLHDAAGTPTGRLKHAGRLATLAWSPDRHAPGLIAVVSMPIKQLEGCMVESCIFQEGG